MEELADPGGGRTGLAPPPPPRKKKRERERERGEKEGTTIEGCEGLTPRGGGGRPPPNLNIHESNNIPLLGFP